jgi:hypothetical protein
VRLSSADGAWFDLRLLRRQVVEVRAVRLSEADWAADWLLVRGEVRTAEGERWAFREPCLTAWEGQRLGSWLRAVAGVGHAPTVAAGTALRFADPTLSFALDDARGDRRLLRVHLTGAAGLRDPAGGAPRGGGVPLDVPAGDLGLAAADWAAELAASAGPELRGP